MPRKSRKQKIKAAARREVVLTTSEFTFTANVNLPKKSLPTETTSDISPIINDLRKTLILGLVFMGALILMYLYSGKLGW